MTSLQIGVTAIGAAAIVWVNWYFFLSSAPTALPRTIGGVQRVPVLVEGGYSPATIRVRVGSPVRLEFLRPDDNSCTEEVVFDSLGLRTFLPTGKTTAVEFTPAAPGTIEFACGMGMIRGKVVVE